MAMIADIKITIDILNITFSNTKSTIKDNTKYKNHKFSIISICCFAEWFSGRNK